MDTQQIKKALADTTREGLESNQIFSFGGIKKGFDISDSTENPEKTQCQKCNPPFVKPRGAVKLCADCKAESRETSAILLENFQRNKKIIPLNRWCGGCDKPKTAAMMSKKLEICRKCADKLAATTGAEQRRIIAHILRNTEKKLREAVR